MYSSKKSTARNQGDDGPTEVMPQESCPVDDEYAPVIFAQDTYKHVVSLDMLSGNVCSFNLFVQKILFVIWWSNVFG